MQEELNHGRSNADIARTMGAAPFIVNKYAAQAKNFTPSQLKEALADCAQAEEDVKTGRLNKIKKDFYCYETLLCFMLRIADKIIARICAILILHHTAGSPKKRGNIISSKKKNIISE